MNAIVDTGVLVALFNRRDRHHKWAKDVSQRFSALLTSESVLSEVQVLLTVRATPAFVVADLIERGFAKIGRDVQSSAARLCNLMRKYSEVPMSLADAALVVVREIHLVLLW
jgi:uncharacterized protein